jgi:hypothetical protein
MTLTPDQIEAERARFEAWAKTKGWRPHAFRRQSDNGEYFYGSSFHAWQGWLAAKQDAKEQA